MASEPPVNETFLREVDDELRRDQIEGFWRTYGRPLVGFVGLFLAAWGGWLWWQSHQTSERGIVGEDMSQAIDFLASGNNGAAEGKLKALRESDHDGYRASARLAEAAIALQKEDVAGATKQYAAIAADKAIAQPWRNLALVRQTAAEFDAMKPEAVIARLQPLAIKGNPWFGSAGEMVALSHLKAGKPDLAARLFAELARDEAVPPSIRERAVQMSGALGLDTAAAGPLAAPAKENAK